MRRRVESKEYNWCAIPEYCHSNGSVLTIFSLIVYVYVWGISFVTACLLLSVIIIIKLLALSNKLAWLFNSGTIDCLSMASLMLTYCVGYKHFFFNYIAAS